MAQQDLVIGVADAGGGDNPFTAFTKIQENFTDLYGGTFVSVTGAVTLDATAFGKMHIVTGTSADYTVDLPTAVGNGGKSIGFVCSSALTKLVTIDANSTETIEGDLVKKIWAKETLVLVSDNTNWIVGNYRQRRMFCELFRSAFSIPNNAATKFLYTTVTSDNTGFIGDAVTNNRFNIPRAGYWKITINATPVNLATTAVQIQVYTYKNGVLAAPNTPLLLLPVASGELNSIILPGRPTLYAAGDYIENYVYQVTGSAAARTFTLQTCLEEVNA